MKLEDVLVLPQKVQLCIMQKQLNGIKKDYLSQDDEIVELIEECKYYLNINHS